MKKINNVIIIGCSIPSLYAGLKCLDLGYKVSIIEKKNSIKVSDAAYHNFNIYNDNHKSFIALLKKYDIKGDKILNAPFDNKLYSMINNVLQKSKLIPQNILLTHTFSSLCRHLMSDKDMQEFNAYDNIFNGIFNVLNASDCINIFTYDLTDHSNYYFLSNAKVNDLMNKMLTSFTTRFGKLIMNNEVKNIKYIKKKYTVYTNMHHILTSDVLFTTISKENLGAFGFWNNDQRLFLNTVNPINASIIKNVLDKLVFTVPPHFQGNIRETLLNDLHIVYPLFTNKSKYIYVWNIGINNILVREKIKSLYNDKFIICSESFSKNNMFITYSLDFVDSAVMRL